jgi:hypothetical protein
MGLGGVILIVLVALLLPGRLQSTQLFEIKSLFI